jgi:hypothetical protein
MAKPKTKPDESFGEWGEAERAAAKVVLDALRMTLAERHNQLLLASKSMQDCGFTMLSMQGACGAYMHVCRIVDDTAETLGIEGWKRVTPAPPKVEAE